MQNALDLRLGSQSPKVNTIHLESRHRESKYIACCGQPRDVIVAVHRMSILIKRASKLGSHETTRSPNLGCVTAAVLNLRLPKVAYDRGPVLIYEYIFLKREKLLSAVITVLLDLELTGLTSP